MFDVTVTLDGDPLRYAFVSHQPDFEDPMYALTDGDGVARFPDISRRATIDVVVHAQNLAVRMLDGTTTSTVEKSLRFRNKSAGDRLNINRRNKSFEHYDVMARCYDAYEVVFRPIAPFNGASRRTFPFGGRTKDVHTLKRQPAVDCRYPETVAPGKLPWVQPQSVTGGRPLIHIKPPSSDRRLFGSSRQPATTIPHEFAHAVHFASLSAMERWVLAAKYGYWIVKELARGNSGTHRTELKTAPLIAFIESIGIFSQRFYLFATEVRPDLSGASLRKAFIADELSGSPSLENVMPKYVRIGTQRSTGVKPHLTGASTEGAVYGAVFLDLASRTSLADVVSLYLRSGATDINGFLTYANKRRKGRLKNDIAEIRRTWKL